MIDVNVCIQTTMDVATTAYGIMLPLVSMLFGTVVLAYICLMLIVMTLSTDHTLLSLLKMNAVVGKGSRPPVAPFGMFECIHNMTSDQQPWFPLRARKALNDTDTFVLPLPRRPVITGDFALGREILMDPLSIKPKVYKEFEPLGIGSIFTRNGSFWVSEQNMIVLQSVRSSDREFDNNEYELTYVFFFPFRNFFRLNYLSIIACSTKRSRAGIFQQTREANESGRSGKD